MTATIVFDSELTSALEVAQKIARQFQHPQYTAPHLLKAILNRDFTLLKTLEAMGKDVFFIEEWADVRMEELPKAAKAPDAPEPEKSMDAIIAEADQVREMLTRETVDLFCVMVALATPGVGFNFDQMKSFPISRSELLNEYDEDLKKDLHELPTERTVVKFIHTYCKNRSAKQPKEATEIVAREEELKQVIEILCRFSKPNVLLLGYPGVGKSAVIEGFIQLIRQNNVPTRLSGAEVFELDLGTLISGASYKGEVEDRLKKIIRELKSFPKGMLVIDGLHLLLDKNSDNSGIASLLSSQAARHITIIATTTIDEYTKKIERDEVLSGMFEPLRIEEPDHQKAFRILKSALIPYRKHHDIQIGDATTQEAIRLAARYLKEKSLPESALNLLDRTLSVIKTSGERFLKEKPALLQRIDQIKETADPIEKQQRLQWLMDDVQHKAQYLSPGEMPVEDVLDDNTEKQLAALEALVERLSVSAQDKKAHIEPVDLTMLVAQKTGIPIGKLQAEEKDRLQHMESILKQRVVGQDRAIQTVCGAVLESRSGLSKAGQPVGSFFFLGPTGTGKTELAKALAEFLFQDENAIIRFDMSEFKEAHSAALLYGAPPGYVGYEEGGLLVNKIREKPYAIVLFDEIEKAHTSVFDVFLQIMDEGKLHDRLGKEGDFSNALILFTSNIGADFIVQQAQEGHLPKSGELITRMAGHFRPEFLGRLTEVVPFGPITENHALHIFDIHLKKDLFDLLEKLNITLTIEDEAKSYLVQQGFNATYGARPLKGIIRSELRRPLAKKIISETVKEGDHITLGLKEQALNWEINNQPINQMTNQTKY